MNREKQIEILDKICPMYRNGTSKRELRHEFFKNIQTEIQAYLLGFFASDGTIDKKRSTMTIKLNEKDSEIIELFRNIISPDARIFINDGYESKATVRKRTIKTNKIKGINITSIIIRNSLVEKGFGFNKTYSELHIPEIPKHLIRHFVRGYFDGDGCISGNIVMPKPVHLQKTKDIKKPAIKQSFSIEGKTINIFEEMQQFFKNNNINTNINYIKRDDS